VPAKRAVEALICEVIAQNNLTCLIVTHDLAQAARMAKRAMVMRAGRLVRSGPVEEVLHAEDMVQ
jgi:ABC-type dipeptide/oligopeptide/nickel transport system ATPase component